MATSYYIRYDAGAGLAKALNTHTGSVDYSAATADLVVASILAGLAGAAGAVSFSADTHVFAADTTMPATVQTTAVSGGTLAPAAGHVLAFVGPLNAGPYQLFGGAGTVTVGPATTVQYGVWWPGGAASTSAQGSLAVAGATALAAGLTVAGVTTLGPASAGGNAPLTAQGVDARLRVHNTNDVLLAYTGNTYTSVQIGLENLSGAAVGVVAAGSIRSLLGADSTGKVGSLTNGYPAAPSFRNVLDDGSGNSTLAGSINVAGAMVVTGGVTHGGTLDVTGATTLHAGLTVAGATSVTPALGVMSGNLATSLGKAAYVQGVNLAPLGYKGAMFGFDVYFDGTNWQVPGDTANTEWLAIVTPGGNLQVHNGGSTGGTPVALTPAQFDAARRLYLDTAGNMTLSGALAATAGTFGGGAVTAGSVTAGTVTVNGAIAGQAAAGVGDVLLIGNDSKLVDINVANMAGLYGVPDNTSGGLRLGNAGFYLHGTATTWQLLNPGFSQVVGVDTAGNMTLAGVINAQGTSSITGTGSSGANLFLAGNGATAPNKYLRAQGGHLQVVNSAYSTVVFDLDDAGNASVPGLLTPAGGLALGSGAPAAGPDLHSDGSNVYLETAGAAFIRLRPNGVGSDTGAATLASTGTLTVVNLTATGTISGSPAAGSVGTTALAGGAVTTAKLATGAVTAATIANTTITAAQIANTTITAAQVANNTLTAAQLAAGAATGAALGADVLSSATGLPANQLVNGGFERWQRATTFTAMANQAYGPDRWQFNQASGAALTITRDGTNVDLGSGFAAACAYTSGGTGASTLAQKVEDYQQFLGLPTTFSARVKTTTASGIRLTVGGASGAYHPGDGAYHTVSVTATVASNAASVVPSFSLEASGTYYLDNAALAASAVPLQYTAVQLAADLARCQRYYERWGFSTGNSMVFRGSGGAGTDEGTIVPYHATKPVLPTITTVGTFTLTNASAPIGQNPSLDEFEFYTQVTAAGNFLVYSLANSGAGITIEANP